MYRTYFWTLWEKARVGCFERTASKHVYYQGWNRSPTQVGCMRQVLGAGALGRPRGMGWGGRQEGGSGWGIHVNPWLIHVNVWQKPLQYCKVISLQLIKINGKKKKKEANATKGLRRCPCYWKGHYSCTSALIPSGRDRWFSLPTCACSDLNVRAASMASHSPRPGLQRRKQPPARPSPHREAAAGWAVTALSCAVCEHKTSLDCLPCIQIWDVPLSMSLSTSSSPQGLEALHWPQSKVNLGDFSPGGMEAKKQSVAHCH